MNAFGSPLPGALKQDGDGQDWEGAWVKNVTPWDTATPAPAIAFMCQRHPNVLADAQRVLVPGCGSGHDAREIARRLQLQENLSAATVTGLDLSSTASKTADLLHRGDPDGAALLEAGTLRFESGDFFTHSHSMSPKSGYDLVWDYTFYCALPPSMRPDWARAMGSLVRRGGGRLATLLFPVDEHEGGPPFAVDVEQARRELEEFGGFECVDLVQVPDEHSLKPRRGREWLGIWKLGADDGAGAE